MDCIQTTKKKNNTKKEMKLENFSNIIECLFIKYFKTCVKKREGTDSNKSFKGNGGNSGIDLSFKLFAVVRELKAKKKFDNSGTIFNITSKRCISWELEVIHPIVPFEHPQEEAISAATT
jgi:hypothetical protein